MGGYLSTLKLKRGRVVLCGAYSCGQLWPDSAVPYAHSGAVFDDKLSSCGQLDEQPVADICFFLLFMLLVKKLGASVL